MVNHKQAFVPLSGVLVQIKYFDRATSPVHILRKHSEPLYFVIYCQKCYDNFCANIKYVLFFIL